MSIPWKTAARAGFKMSELENCAFMFADSMKPLGVDLAKLLDSGVELHYSEVSVAGATTAASAAHHLWMIYSGQTMCNSGTSASRHRL